MTKTFITYWTRLNKALRLAKCPEATADEAKFFFPSRTLDAEVVNAIRAKIECEGSI